MQRKSCEKLTAEKCGHFPTCQKGNKQNALEIEPGINEKEKRNNKNKKYLYVFRMSGHKQFSKRHDFSLSCERGRE